MRKLCKKTRKYIETVCMGVIEPGGKQRVKYCVSETAVERETGSNALMFSHPPGTEAKVKAGRRRLQAFSVVRG